MNLYTAAPSEHLYVIICEIINGNDNLHHRDEFVYNNFGGRVFSKENFMKEMQEYIVSHPSYGSRGGTHDGKQQSQRVFAWWLKHGLIFQINDIPSIPSKQLLQNELFADISDTDVSKKKCSTCKKLLPVDEFYKRKDGALIAACKSCHKERVNNYQKEKYHDPNSTYKEEQIKRSSWLKWNSKK